MIEFIRAHHEVLATSASLFTAAIWLVYLNLFYASMRRSRRPEILLSRSAGSGRGARLFISNMGAEKTYRVIRKGDELVFHPEKITTTQLRSWIARRRLQKRLESEMRDAL